MKIRLQEALTAMEAKVRNSLSRLSGVQVGFNKIEKRGGFFVVYTVCVPIPDAAWIRKRARRLLPGFCRTTPLGFLKLIKSFRGINSLLGKGLYFMRGKP
ncbi:MAG: hypothetical protein LBI67_05555 [Treponema sp.]|jgi:hypothetical protein|nr:hypothetical protein [Treponema sp.]